MSSSLTQPLPQTVALIEHGRSDGLHLGGQLYVSQRGAVLADLALGDARIGVPMQAGTLMLWLSATKPIAAIAIAQLQQRSLLDWDDPVTRFIPEFADGGKTTITLRHLLTHTGGFRTADKCDLGTDWSEIIACVCATPAEPHWVPGEKAGYHLSASWFILGEVVRRLDGRPFEDYARQQIFQPCGMAHSRLALTPAEFRKEGDRIGLIYHTDKGFPAPHRRWNSEADAAVCRPGRGARGPVRELGFLYEVLLKLRNGDQQASASLHLQADTVRSLTARQRIGMFDDTFQHVLDWGFGFGIDSKRYGLETVPYGYGRFCSEATFGHSGAQSTCAFADPQHDLVVAWALNGMPGEHRHQSRAREINSAIYQDLGLVGKGLLRI